MDIGLAVGGAFISSALNVLFDRLAPQGELFKMFQKHTTDFRLLKKLRLTLLGLQAVLSDTQNKQASNPYVSQWLNELQDAVDCAENLIEEVNYEVLRVKVEDQGRNLGETSNLQVSCHLSLSLSAEFFLNIKDKLEETIETLEDLQKQIGLLDMKSCLDSGKQETRRPSTSVVDEADIFGRKNEIEELIDCVLSEDGNGKNLTVVPIVGMGGVGKTTLAKAVYNDEKVKDHFGLKAWICVSESYDSVRITKELLQEISSSDCMVNNTLNQLQIKLKESLKGKKFLIVLDDVWNDNYEEWDDLRNIFVQGDIGSKIIVTTRKETVSLMMSSRAINVGILSSEVSWALFKRHSFENRAPEEHPEFQEVGKQIARKCKGLPLSLKALAGILRSKAELNEWKDILRSEIWELPSHSNGILPALMLSYRDLPAHLKRCFAFCAIYPKDYLFCKEQVVQLWIANGLVQQLASGNQYFHELRSRSLFERSRECSEWNSEGFLMHDLVNDLAQIASSNLCIRLEDIQGSHMLEQSRHISYLMGHGDFGKLKPLYKLKQLRTLLPITTLFGYSFKLSKRVLHDILPRLTSLRALSLSHYQIKELPNDLFIKLKHLRFLDLSSTEIKKLPDSICALYTLETLLLSSCRYLEELPLNLEKLINLRYLDISSTASSRLKMSLHPSKLKSLHVLVGAKFLLTSCSGLRIGYLGELQNLYGALSILELQNVVDRRETQKANMREKEHVKRLSLEWNTSIADNSQTERDILDELHPHNNIEKLQINGYRGTKFPNWLADQSFLKLVGLSLSNCKDCDSLPALGQLPSLKFLAIRGMHRITEVTEEFYGSSSTKKPFYSLEKLEFAEMPEWKQWHVLGNGEFPTLHELSIKGCPKFIGKLPENLRSLSALRISKCPELILETPIQLSCLKLFKIVGSPKVGVLFDDVELFTSQLEGMKQIVELSITDCNSLTSLPISSDFTMFLEKLILVGCDSIDEISPELVPRAHTLTVKRCHSLTRLVIPAGIENLYIRDCENLEILSVAWETQMMSLRINNCENLKSLPDHMHELFPSLKEMDLQNCPEIESFPDGGLPLNLELLWINDCKKLVNGRKEWHLQTLPCLRELCIFHDGSDEEILANENWELPSSIRNLYISNLKTLSSQVLKSLTSLDYLYATNLPQVHSLLEGGLPSSLSELELYRHHDLHSLPTEGLQRLTSLRRLAIWDCPNLQSLPESAIPSSLSVLAISYCPNLQSLPVKSMPPSMSTLSIYECPLLKPLLEFDTGDYWPNIAHIPTIEIDWEYQ
ncbi:putative disease resistance RPP13-like protein 1 [Capsicum chacoense]